MPATPIYALPYPAPTDPADGPDGYADLALAVETMLGGPPVTSLPGTPADGQLVRYKVGANGPVWTFQYLAGSAAPYRWHFVGGAPLHGAVATSEQCNSTAYVNLATAGPDVTLPLAGEYQVSHGAVGASPLSRLVCYLSFAIGAAAATDANAAYSMADPAATGPSVATLVRDQRITAATAASLVRVQYRITTGQLFYERRWITALPVRVS